MKADHAWREYTTSEFCKSVRDGTHDSPKFRDEGHPLVTSKAVKDGRLLLETAGLISEQDFLEINRRSKVDRWDVIFTMIGTLGEVYLEKSDEIDYAIKNVGLFKCGEELRARWLFHWFRSPKVKAAFLQLRRGASQQYLPLSALRSLPVRFPEDEGLARDIVDTASAYDDLIENNRRRIALLEEAARQLYKEWFVRFRFPGHEHVKIIEGVPEGWSNEPLFELASPTYGYAFKSKLFSGEQIGKPVVRIRDVPKRESVTWTSEEAPEDKLLENGDFLVGMDGDFHMNYWAGGQAWLNQRVVRLAGMGKITTGLLRSSVEQQIKDLNETITGTTVKHLGAKHLKQIELLVPPDSMLLQANEFFEHNREMIVNLSVTNRKLSKARDLLLPKLMNGSITV